MMRQFARVMNSERLLWAFRRKEISQDASNWKIKLLELEINKNKHLPCSMRLMTAQIVVCLLSLVIRNSQYRTYDYGRAFLFLFHTIILYDDW